VSGRRLTLSPLQRLKATVSTAVRVRPAARGIRAICAAHPSAIRVCWDLDNTLIDSGSLLRDGLSLTEAVVLASPMAKMLEFFEEMHQRLPGAEHVALSARHATLRPETLAWIDQNGPALAPERIFLVPNAEAKPALWRALAQTAPLVIVDDLTFGHHDSEVSQYAELVEAASKIATSYVGHSTIAAVESGERTPAAVAAQVIADLAPAARQTPPRG
jgi:hypothetical protein